MKRNRIICLLLAAMLLFTLCACGGDKKSDDPNHYDFGKYSLDYKGACIMYSESGDDALVVTFDFTNNSKDDASYGWTVYEKAMQDGVELESAYVITDMETYASVSENYFTDIAPGKTLEVSNAYKLNGTGDVEVKLSDLFDKYTYTITVDPTTLERVENEYSDFSAWDSLMDEYENGSDNGQSTSAAAEKFDGDAAFLNWWDGDWYGWWIITDGTGLYDQYDGYWWDACAKIEARSDLTGSIEIWDDVGSIDSLTGSIEVSFSDAGVGEHGTMFSESGAFSDDILEHADWIIDPGLEKVDDLLWINGSYDGEEGGYSYEMYLRPWGTLWDDMTMDVTGYENSLPYSYDWYVGLVNSGASMPTSFEGASDVSVPSDTPADTPDDTTGETETAPAGAEKPTVAFTTTKQTFMNSTKVTMSFMIPDGMWCVDDGWDNFIKINNSDEPDYVPFHNVYMRVQLWDEESSLNTHLNDFGNLTELESYTIGGIEMKGRSYDYFGIEGIVEYYGQLPNGVWVSVEMHYVDAEYGNDAATATCYAILDTMSFK